MGDRLKEPCCTTASPPNGYVLSRRTPPEIYPPDSALNGHSKRLSKWAAGSRCYGKLRSSWESRRPVSEFVRRGAQRQLSNPPHYAHFVARLRMVTWRALRCFLELARESRPRFNPARLTR